SEIVARQPAHHLATLVSHDDVDEHQLGAAAEHGDRGLLALSDHRERWVQQENRDRERHQDAARALGTRPSGQNLNLVRIWRRRGARAVVTCPKVGELTIVSIAEYCGVLNRLLANSCTESTRLVPNITLRVTPRFTLAMPGPTIVLRPALPN